MDAKWNGKCYRSSRGSSWFFRWKAPSGDWRGKAVPVDIQDELIAVEWAREWISQLQTNGGKQSLNEEIARTPPTLQHLVPRWITWKKDSGISHREYGRLECSLNKWVLTQPISRLNVETQLSLGSCVTWIEWLQKQRKYNALPLKPNTVRNIVQLLRGVLVDARGKGWIEMRENPLLDPYVRKVLRNGGHAAPPIVVLTWKEAKALVSDKRIPAERRLRYLFALTTGARHAEMHGLTREDIDLKAGVVHIRRQAHRDGPDGAWVTKPPKRGSARTLPLHPALAKSLAKTTELFGDDRRWSEVLRLDLATCGHPRPDATFHALRRSFMTFLEGEGVERHRIGELAGHAAKGVTASNYLKVQVPLLAAAVAKLRF